MFNGPGPATASPRWRFRQISDAGVSMEAGATAAARPLWCLRWDGRLGLSRFRPKRRPAGRCGYPAAAPEMVAYGGRSCSTPAASGMPTATSAYTASGVVVCYSACVPDGATPDERASSQCRGAGDSLRADIHSVPCRQLRACPATGRAVVTPPAPRRLHAEPRRGSPAAHRPLYVGVCAAATTRWSVARNGAEVYTLRLGLAPYRSVQGVYSVTALAAARFWPCALGRQRHHQA